MIKHPTRIAQTALATLAGALLTGGGYALASSNSQNTIKGCVVKSTHQLLIQKKCRRGQTRLAWAKDGPQGPQGPPAAGAWAVIGTFTGGAGVSSGRNITVRYDTVGEYTITATGPCANTVGAVEVNPEAPQAAAGHVPVAYATKESGTANVFDVRIFDVGPGGATPIDGLAFDVTVNCQ
ncbi:MAG: hypothetical protein ABSG43_12350 [Solirubrobacteraceae bacterium]